MQHPPKVFFPFLDMTIKKGAGQDQQVNTISISRIDLILFLYFRLWCPFLVENGINFLFYFLKRIETGGAGVDIYFFTSGFVIPLLLIPFFLADSNGWWNLFFFFAPPGGVSRGVWEKSGASAGCASISFIVITRTADYWSSSQSGQTIYI